VYIIAVHIPFAGLALIPVILGWPVLLHPVHIVFAGLVALFVIVIFVL
jgi:Ca2+-transporting ATPase